MTGSLLAEWDNFYVIAGSSAGGLTGLTFVVIALASDAKRINMRGLRVYVTPTIVHFCSRDRTVRNNAHIQGRLHCALLGDY
jgi:hypothetical protein